jgi:uncharacterized protein
MENKRKDTNCKKYLFFFVHPAKFHLSRKTINALKDQGNRVDIIITGRDILEELVQNEGWEYTKIFPTGRKIKGVHTWISASIFLILTVIKLLKITFNNHYDMFITDDLLTFIGRIKRVPSIFVTDDDLSAVPESVILMISATYILAPEICELGKYNSKKLGYYGYKAIFHLHPNHFHPSITKLPKELHGQKYYFIRTVSATSTHDVGKRGIGDEILREIIKKLQSHGKVVLNSERKVPNDLKKYLLKFKKNDVSHIINYADLFISDSTTMCVEAAILGVPSIEFDDWFSDFKQYDELNQKYELLYGFGYDTVVDMMSHIDRVIGDKDIKLKLAKKQKRMLNDKIDASAFLIWFLTNYPESSAEFFKDRTMQLRFN